VDPPRPQTAYGRQKAEAEAAVLAQPGAAVLRCSKIIGPGDLRLMAWRTALLTGRPLVAFDDLNVAPLSLDDAVTALIDIGDSGEPGIFQLSGRDETTYFSMALALAEYLGVDEPQVLRASAEAEGVATIFCPRGVRLEQALPHPIDVAPLDVVIARALA
jgi:dTDP-4-dehydrorhamnose reductase